MIESRFAALRLEKGNFVKFTELAEKQAEAYRRSLVNKGISRAKEQELAVRKTVELYRKTTRSEVVKSVLASSKFDTPSEVLAKYVTENDIAYKDKRESEKFKNGNNKGSFDKNNGKHGKFNKFNKSNNGGNNGGNNSGNSLQKSSTIDDNIANIAYNAC